MAVRAACGGAARGVHISSSLPEPKLPTSKSQVNVSGCSATMRLLSLSATKRRPPPSARPSGWLNSPGAQPCASTSISTEGVAAKAGAGSRGTSLAALRTHKVEGFAVAEAQLAHGVARTVAHE